MPDPIIVWLGELGSAVFRWSALGFVLLNGFAVVAFSLTRDRGLVNRWTGRMLAANIFLLGAGVGIPVVALASRLALQAVTSGNRVVLPVMDRDVPEHLEERELRSGQR
ncbi:MAG: hypothetical protein ACT4OZ_08230 [Gemmatimonadota bacterium]